MNDKKFKQILKKNGYKLDRQKGDHCIYYKEDGTHISVPMGANPFLLKHMIKWYNLTV